MQFVQVPAGLDHRLVGTGPGPSVARHAPLTLVGRIPAEIPGLPVVDVTVFYFDWNDNKYIAKGGSLANRLNNPGLIPSRGPFAKQFGSIGSYKHYAIFPNVLTLKKSKR